MRSPYKNIIQNLRRANEVSAETLGLLTYEKSIAGAPAHFRLVDEDEIAALEQANIRYIPRVCANPSSKMGWVDSDVYELIVQFEQFDDYAGLTLAEWLIKTSGH